GAVVHAAVDPDGPGPDPARDTHSAVGRGGQHRTGETVFAVVGEPYRRVVVGERCHHQHRTEDLLPPDGQARVLADEYGRFDVVAGGQMGRQVLRRAAADDEAGAVADRPVVGIEYFGALGRADQRPDHGFRQRRVAYGYRLECGRDTADHFVENRSVHQHAARRGAGLPGVHADT